MLVAIFPGLLAYSRPLVSKLLRSYHRQSVNDPISAQNRVGEERATIHSRQRLYSGIMRRTAQIAVLFSFLLGISAACRGQLKLALHDVRKHRTPVRVSGTISFQDDPSQAIRYTYRTEGFLSNVSKKGVLLTVVHLEASGVNAPGLDSNWIIDRFFGPAVLQAGKLEKIEAPPISFGETIVNGKPAPEAVGPDAHPRARAQVTFVQFVDGSTWGDVDAGREFILRRRSTLEELKWLEQVLNAQGPDVFARELSNSAATLQFPAIGALISVCKSKADSCLIDGLHSTLQAATKHQAEVTEPQYASLSGLKE